MNLLLDTHVVLWWLADDPRLSPAARQVVADPAHAVWVSAVTVWEIAIKRSLGKLVAPDGWYDALAEEPFRRLDIGWEHARRAGELPRHHGDPFDRLLVAQALLERLTLVTGDEALRRYDADVLAV